VNAGTLYTQKHVFDSVDPWALTYTTYYNGKVLYNDVRQDTVSYEQDWGNNLSTTYERLADDGSFNMSISEGINKSMKDAGTSLEEVASNSRIAVSVSNFTDAVYSGWLFNDREWDAEQPDLINDVTHEVYSAAIQGQVFRNGFNTVYPYGLQVGKASYSGVSYETGESEDAKDIIWTGHYPVNISHSCALTPDHIFSGTLDVKHRVNVDASSHKWYFRSARVKPVSADVLCEGVDVTYEYLGNDSLLDIERVDGYLSSENHSFDWKITYKIRFRVRTCWNIYYDYHWSYRTCTAHADGTVDWDFHYGDSSGSLKGRRLTDIASIPHVRTESEDMCIVYHQYMPSGGYAGIGSYGPGNANDYRNTTLVIDGALKTDPCCSDAADRYRDEYVKPRMAAIQSGYMVYSNASFLPTEKICCEVPDWLHRTMTREMESMFDAINADNPAREISLLGGNLGKDPTTLIRDASLDLTAEMAAAAKRGSFTGESGHMNGTQFKTSSDAARAIAKNEAYDRLLQEMAGRSSKIGSHLENHMNSSFSMETGGYLSELVGSSVPADLLFNNPAMEKASNALSNEMGIIRTMEITGKPRSRYNWTENMTLLIDQYPDYLYHDPDFDLQEQYQWVDESSGRIVYPLGVRNVCVFSTGVADDIAEMLKDCSDPLKDVISQSMSQSIADMNAEIDSLAEDLNAHKPVLVASGVSADIALIEDNRTRLVTGYSARIRQEVPVMVAEEVASDPVLGTWIDRPAVISITSAYLETLSDRELVCMVAEDTIGDEILALITERIMADNPGLSPDNMSVALYRIEADMRIGVANGVCEAIRLSQEMIDECFMNINAELQKKLEDSGDKLSGKLAEKMEKKLQRSMKLVPCGLPVIPGHWVCTVNMWEYDVVGKYRRFEVVDNDNECIFNPYSGHETQVYVREEKDIYHPFSLDETGFSLKIGENVPIYFNFKGYAATVVGPGPKGVGDKIGSRDEKSIDYDSLLAEYGELYG
ncbi:MAG: hypothetical protein JW705_06140, partial [Methanosarcinaceae archaeon]|nr:hypothetical protein [Methanosarcinaceae archaeon]